MHLQTLRTELFLQPRDQIAIKLNHVHVIKRLQQQARHRCQAGTDLDHDVVLFRRNGADDVVQDGLIGQKILAKTFTGDVFHREFLARAISAAVLMASIMLPWSTEVRMIGRPSVILTPWPKLANLSTGKP